MTDEEVERFDKYRRVEGNNLGDPLWYQKLPRSAGINIPASLITVQSGIFGITVIGMQGRVTERITGVVKRESSRRKVSLLSWKVE